MRKPWGAAAVAEDVGDEKERLVRLLEKHGGNISAIARELETSRTQVQRLITRSGLDGSGFKNS